MASQAEVSAFDDVYQWETVDPVQGGAGGVANLPIAQLTHRTRYLLDQSFALAAVVGTKAPTDSPILTGTPRSPTPAPDAAGTQLVTAEWARRQAGGVFPFSMYGDFQLNAAQAGYGVLNIGGILTADSFLLFPPGQGRWIIANFTTGGFAVKVRLGSGGSVVPVSCGRVRQVWTDGANFVPSEDDFDAISITGVATTSTPDPTDNSARIPNTSWVRGYAGGLVTNESNVRAAADNGEAQARYNADVQILNTLPFYARLDQFAHSAPAPDGAGYQFLPSGFLIQWGSGTTDGTGKLCSVPWTLPFPHQMLSVVVTEDGVAGWGDPPAPTLFGTQTVDQYSFGLSCAKFASGNPVAFYAAGVGYRWIAIGY